MFYKKRKLEDRDTRKVEDTKRKREDGHLRATERGPTQTLPSQPSEGTYTLLLLRSHTSNLQNWEKIKFCWLSHPICGLPLRQPWPTHTKVYDFSLMLSIRGVWQVGFVNNGDSGTLADEAAAILNVSSCGIRRKRSSGGSCTDNHMLWLRKAHVTSTHASLTRMSHMAPFDHSEEEVQSYVCQGGGPTGPSPAVETCLLCAKSYPGPSELVSAFGLQSLPKKKECLAVLHLSKSLKYPKAAFFINNFSNVSQSGIQAP